MSDEWNQIEIWSTRIAGVTAIFGAAYAAYRVIRNAVGKVFGMANRIQMISDQMVSNGGTSMRDAINRIEERQIRNEQRERAYLHTHSNMMCEMDEHLFLVWANRAFLDTLDVDSDAVANYGWQNLIVEEDRDNVIRQFVNAKEACRNFSTSCTLIVGWNSEHTCEATIIGTVMRNTNLETSGFLVTIRRK